MYKKSLNQPEFEDFYLPFNGKLSPDKRWVILADQIPWTKIEDIYCKNFAESAMGAPAKSVRLALGALIIKEYLGVSDEEVVKQIGENPYLQFFIGGYEFQDKAPFDASMLVHFRKCFTQQELMDINKMIIQDSQANSDYLDSDKAEDSDNENGDNYNVDDCDGVDENIANHGKLIVDATCAPADISYPTDLNLLNEAREKAEAIIDTLHEPLKGKRPKPRTYRKRARNQYLSFIKKRKHRSNISRKAIRKQLNYLRRDLKFIEELGKIVGYELLSKKQYRDLLVINELYRQQKEMYDTHSNRIADRITSISQPHVRPIVRGKVKSPVEFGAKISASLIDGFTYIDRISFDAYNESTDLIGLLESYYNNYGYYPESVHADKIYRTRENRKYCQDREIRLSGPALGRPPKDTEQRKAQKKQIKQDEIDRIAIEGKFGQAKRRFSLGKVMSKLESTSISSILITFITINLEKILKDRKRYFCAHILSQLIDLVHVFKQGYKLKDSFDLRGNQKSVMVINMVAN